MKLTAAFVARRLIGRALDAESLTTAAIVDFARGTNPAAIIDTHRRSEDTNALIAIRHFAYHPPLINVLLANSGAGDQFKRVYKIARGQKSSQGGAASAFEKQLRPGSEQAPGDTKSACTNYPPEPGAPEACSGHRHRPDSPIVAGLGSALDPPLAHAL